MGVVHLIRHGRPAIAGVLLGSSDVPLSGEPIAPSELNPGAIFSSPLQRALRTAEQLFPGRQIATVPGFAERGLGEWEGKRWPEIEIQYPELAAMAARDWFGTTPPGAEPWNDFVARVERAWRALPLTPSMTIVAHAGVNGVLAHIAAGHELASFQQDYLEVVSFAVSD